MGDKTNFIEELLAQTLTPVIIGEVGEITMPTTKDGAIMAIAQCAVNANNAILRQMAGLDITALVQQSGSRNPILVSALLSRLEVITDRGGKCQIVSPTEGATTANPFLECALKGKGITAAACSIDGTEVSLSQAGDTWSGHPSAPISIGKHGAAFTATFGDGATFEKTVNFEITAKLALVDSFPKKETSYRPEEITTISATLSDEAAISSQAVNVSVFGQSFTLEKKEGNVYQKDLATLNLSLFDWAGLNLMLVSIENEDGTTTEEIRFEIRGGEEEEGGE